MIDRRELAANKLKEARAARPAVADEAGRVKSTLARIGVVGCMVAGSLIAASPASGVAGYGDVEDGRWFTKPVQWSVDNDITGIGGTCFSPDAVVSRGEASLWLWNMADQPSAPAHSFVDITDDEQDAAVSWMSQARITTGTSPTTFAPDEPLNRVQLVTFLWRLAGEPRAPGHPFVDVHRPWQQGSVSWASHNLITLGTSETTFAPEEPLRRSHLVTFLWRYQGRPPVTVDPDTPPCDPSAPYVPSAPSEPEAAFKAISSGSTHSCVIKADDTISCWGNNESGQADVPAGTYKAVSAGNAHTCAISTDDTISCWGNNHYGQADEPAGTYKAVSAGGAHTCAISTDDTVRCWGDNEHEQDDEPAGTFKAVSAGLNHTCALSTDDAVECWGDNFYGQTDVPEGTFKTVSAGLVHACAISTDDAIECWGSNDISRHTDVPAGTFKTVSAGGTHTCAIDTDDAIECWGDNFYGQTDVPAGRYSMVSSGDLHVCAIGTDDTIRCWGNNEWGQTDATAASAAA